MWEVESCLCLQSCCTAHTSADTPHSTHPPCPGSSTHRNAPDPSCAVEVEEPAQVAACTLLNVKVEAQIAALQQGEAGIRTICFENGRCCCSWHDKSGAGVLRQVVSDVWLCVQCVADSFTELRHLLLCQSAAGLAGTS